MQDEAHPIDWARVAELRDEIGDDEFGEVVGMFLEEVDAMIDALGAAPPAEVEEHMHAIKGASMNIGFAALAEICRRGEAAAAGGAPEAVPPVEVMLCHRRSRSMFLDGLSQGRAA